MSENKHELEMIMKQAQQRDEYLEVKSGWWWFRYIQISCRDQFLLLKRGHYYVVKFLIVIQNDDSGLQIEILKDDLDLQVG